MVIQFSYYLLLWTHCCVLLKPVPNNSAYNVILGADNWELWSGFQDYKFKWNMFLYREPIIAWQQPFSPTCFTTNQYNIFNINFTAFSDVTLCNPVKFYRCFERTYCLIFSLLFARCLLSISTVKFVEVFCRNIGERLQNLHSITFQERAHTQLNESWKFPYCKKRKTVMK
jgi:hypothetical protein